MKNMVATLPIFLSFGNDTEGDLHFRGDDGEEDLHFRGYDTEERSNNSVVIPER